MTSSILVVTHAPHAPFCRLLLRSLAKHARGFERVLLLTPAEHMAAFTDMCKEANECGGIRINHVCCYEFPNGHVGQTITKTFADVWLPEAEMIVHLDADCVATRSFSPADYLGSDGRTTILTKPYSAAGDAGCWQSHVELALGEKTPLETMQSPALAYHREVYACTRNMVEKRQSEPFVYFCLRHGCWPEFNGLGHVALNHFPDLHRGVDVDGDEGRAWPRFIKQGWSRAADNPDALRTELARLEAAIG